MIGLSQGCEGNDTRSIVDASQLPPVSPGRDSAVVADAAFIEELPQMVDQDADVVQTGSPVVPARRQTPADLASGDPGTPSTPYGAKADAHLFVGADEVGYGAFTAVAPNRADMAQLYASIDTRQSKGVSDYYISLVVERGPWHPGEFQAAVGGRVRFTLSNGKTYSANGSGLMLKLVLTGAGALPADTECILRGKMEMTVPADESGQAPLQVVVQINTAI